MEPVTLFLLILAAIALASLAFMLGHEVGMSGKSRASDMAYRNGHAAGLEKGHRQRCLTGCRYGAPK